MDDDLNAMSREQLITEVQKLRDRIARQSFPTGGDHLIAPPVTLNTGLEI